MGECLVLLLLLAYPGAPWATHMCARPSLLQLQVGVEFEASTRMQDTSASFGYQLDLPKANFLFKGKEGLSFPPGKQTKAGSHSCVVEAMGDKEYDSVLGVL